MDGTPQNPVRALAFDWKERAVAGKRGGAQSAIVRPARIRRSAGALSPATAATNVWTPACLAEVQAHEGVSRIPAGGRPGLAVNSETREGEETIPGTMLPLSAAASIGKPYDPHLLVRRGVTSALDLVGLGSDCRISAPEANVVHCRVTADALVPPKWPLNAKSPLLGDFSRETGYLYAIWLDNLYSIEKPFQQSGASRLIRFP